LVAHELLKYYVAIWAHKKKVKQPLELPSIGDALRWRSKNGFAFQAVRGIQRHKWERKKKII
jgi:hypothetical protein